jgi:hypothetical protein
MTVEGTTDGHAQAADISSRKLRAILDAVHGIHPKDDSDASKQLRRIDSYGDLSGARFAIKVGVEPAKGSYPAKNIIKQIITPDQVGYSKLDQGPPPPFGGGASGPSLPTPPAAPIARPNWAR